jgi:hypothetical protein
MVTNQNFLVLALTEYTLKIDETDHCSTRKGEKYIDFVDTSEVFCFYLNQQRR